MVRKTPGKLGDVMQVVWGDAVTQGGWTDLADMADEPVQIVSVGILVSDSSTAVVLALSVDTDNTQTNGTVAIPKGWIEDMWVLAKGAV